FSEVVEELHIEEAFSRICQRVANNAHAHIKGAAPVECILTDFEKGLVLGRAAHE
ncbi:MAG: hypothetical protein NTZ05_05620, partial [Chloroflexi bacterium]|nr:hypothetical protein [Chloroflexota bacterium]